MNQSPLLELHQAAGARLAPNATSAGVLTYGDVPAEYQAGVAGALLFDATERGCLRATGADAEGFLHRLLANQVIGLEPGAGNRNLLLSGKGKVQHVFDLVRLEEGFELSTPQGDAPRLAAALDMYLFADDVELAETTEQHAPLELVGPRAHEVAAGVLDGELGAPLSSPGTLARSVARFQGAAVQVDRLELAGSPGLRLDPGPERVRELWQALVAGGARPGGLVAFDSLRAEAGRARWGQDLTDTVYPQEARLEGAFALDKGCYIGQEVVAKIDTYGGLNKKLMALRVSDDDPVPPGTRLYREQNGEWRDLGLVTSWVYSFALDGGLVLAYVKRKHQAPGTQFRLGDGPRHATLVPLPLRANCLLALPDSPPDGEPDGDSEAKPN